MGRSSEACPKGGRQGCRGRCPWRRRPGLRYWVGHDGLALILATAIAIRDINGAVGRAGGAFDRLLKTIEKVAAKKSAHEPEEPPKPEKPATKGAKKKRSRT